MAVMSLVLPSNVVFASNGAELRGTSPSGYLMGVNLLQNGAF